MLPRHARTLNSLAPDVLDYLLFYFSCRPLRGPGDLPSIALAEKGYGQADVVLALLRADEPRFFEAAERMMGQRITRCPPFLGPHYMPLANPDSTDADRRRILRVDREAVGRCRNHRMSILREGMSVDSFLARGGLRRDIGRAVKRGWIELETM